MSNSEFKKMSNEELERIIGTASGTSASSNSALWELQRRHLNPHWTLTPSFWVAVTAMLFAAIAAWPVIQGRFLSSPVASKAPNSQPQQSQSARSLSTKAKTSVSSDHPKEPPNHWLEESDAPPQP